MNQFVSRRLESDDTISNAIRHELDRQLTQIELIASENIVSPAVMAAQGNVLTNKYAEGYPGRWYYGGCEFVDLVEAAAIEREKRLFGCQFANVQPHSGAQANGTVLLALMKPGETLLGMSLDAGGHLTHGARPTLSGKWFNAVQYGVRQQDGLMDFEEVAAAAQKHQPKIIIRDVVPTISFRLLYGFLIIGPRPAADPVVWGDRASDGRMNCQSAH